MNEHARALILIAAIILSFTVKSVAQTCLVNTGKFTNGAVIYTEVYEYDYVEEKPQFPGGGQALINYINSNRNYPSEAYEKGIQGRVTCSFVVNPDGKISHIQVLRGVEESLNNEAMRIISEMPVWNPGKIEDHKVPVRVVCCIPFRK